MTILRLAAAVALSAAVAAASVQAQQPATPLTLEDLNGEWIVQDPGSGTWTAFMEGKYFPQAEVPEKVKEYQRAVQENVRAGNVVNTNANSNRTDCVQGTSLSMFMAQSNPKTLEVGPAAVMLATRVIYTDGRPHPDTKSPDYKPTALGHSVGKWDGRALVVDTIGFPGWGRMCDVRWTTSRVPGGGVAVDTTRLVERFALLDRNTIEITFTWTDPAVFLKPHTYSFKLARHVAPAEVDPPDAPPKREFLTDKYWER